MTAKPGFPRLPNRIASVLAVSAIALGLAACDKMKLPTTTETTGQRIDSAIEKTENAAAKAEVEARKAFAETQARLKVGAAKTEVVAEKAGEAMRDAGSSALALAEDAAVTAQVSAGLAKDPGLSVLKIDVDTHAGLVTLNGPAPTQSARERATAIAQSVKGVVSVVNHLTVPPG